MLGIWALGERALGQLIGRTTATLLVSQGSFSLAGQSVTFKGALATASGAAYALNGPAVTFEFGEVAAPGAYALTGNAASFLGALTAAQGAFALTGFAFTEAFYFDAAGGSYALTGFPALDSRDFNRDSVGSSVSGGNFSRKRWRDMLDEEERERAAAVRKIADARLRRRAEARHRRRAEAEARRAARAHQKERGEALADAMAAAHHGAAARGLAALRDVARAVGAQARDGHAAAARTALEQDDEDVIALVMGMVSQ
jgi:hypothetical protein